jgi:uncharacterized protein YbcC (UPF0753/DUF2309 family)
MKTLGVAAIALMVLTGVAFSQSARESGSNSNTEANKMDAASNRAAAERKKQMELDAAYKAALDKTQTKNAPADPWASVRPANAPATNR